MDREGIVELLSDYNWMMNEIEKERKEIKGYANNITAQYGIEATMPKPKGGNSDPVYQEVERKLEKSKRIQKLEKKVLFIQKHRHVITDDREMSILDCLLDGMSMSAISAHMGLSVRHIQRMKRSIASQMSGMSGMSESVTKKKCYV